jgi:maleate isomerase
MAEAIRLGVIVPSVNIVVEEWYPRIVPGGVSVHFARMLIADGSSPEKIIAMDREDGMRAIRQIASCRPHAVAYGCTASSIVQGHAFDEPCAARSGTLPGLRQPPRPTASSPPAGCSA